MNDNYTGDEAELLFPGGGSVNFNGKRFIYLGLAVHIGQTGVYYASPHRYGTYLEALRDIFNSPALRENEVWLAPPDVLAAIDQNHPIFRRTLLGTTLLADSVATIKDGNVRLGIYPRISKDEHPEIESIHRKIDLSNLHLPKIYNDIPSFDASLMFYTNTTSNLGDNIEPARHKTTIVMPSKEKINGEETETTIVDGEYAVIFRFTEDETTILLNRSISDRPDICRLPLVNKRENQF